VCERYYDVFREYERTDRDSKVYVPVDIKALASSLHVDTDIVLPHRGAWLSLTIDACTADRLVALERPCDVRTDRPQQVALCGEGTLSGLSRGN